MKRKITSLLVASAVALVAIVAPMQTTVTVKAAKVIKEKYVIPVGGGVGRKDVTYKRWKSSNPKVAEDNGIGWIEAKKIGTAVLTGKVDKTQKNAGATVKLTVKVIEPYKIKCISKKATKDKVTYKIKNCMNKPFTIYTSKCYWGANDEWLGYNPYQSQSTKTITIQPNKVKSITLTMKKNPLLDANSPRINHILGIKCDGVKFLYTLPKKGAYGEYYTCGWAE